MWWIILIAYTLLAWLILLGNDDFVDINSSIYEVFTEPINGPLKGESNCRIWKRLKRLINVIWRIISAVVVFVILYLFYSVLFIPYLVDMIHEEFTIGIPRDLQSMPGVGSKWKKEHEIKTYRKKYPETIHREIFLSADIPFTPSADEIIYLENEYDEPRNKYIRDNFAELTKLFEEKGFKFCYFPAMTDELLEHFALSDEQTGKDAIRRKVSELNRDVILKYLHEVGIVQYTDAYPDKYAITLPRPCKCTPDKIHPSFIHFKGAYDYEGESLNCKEDIDGRSYYRYSYRELKPVKKNGATLHSQIINYIADLQKYSSVIRFRSVSNGEDSERDKEIKEDIKRQKEASEETIASDVLSALQSGEVPAEETIEGRNKLVSEIKTSIDKLLQMGVGKGVIMSLLNIPDKLSRLVVTKDHKILLTDYNNAEIPMSPLPKALFILFLKHPKGISFKEISDCKEELTNIYMSISGRENIDNISKSISSLVDPYSNSLNEKCSRIREAFMYRLSESIARNYFITGGRGETKKITLDRQLVTFE